MNNIKNCTKCNIPKSLSDFWKNKSSKDGYQSWCKSCHSIIVSSKLSGSEREKYLRMRRNGHLMNKYGITADDYDKLFIEQDSACAICFVKIDSSGKSLAVDHDHITGHIRGILCGDCNKALGLFRDSELIVKNAQQYLSKNKGRS